MKRIVKLTKNVKRSEATAAPLSGWWVEGQRGDGAPKARWATGGREQTLKGNSDFSSATPAAVHLKRMLVDAAQKGHVAAIGDCSGAFYRAPLDPEGGQEVCVEPPPGAVGRVSSSW